MIDSAIVSAEMWTSLDSEDSFRTLHIGFLPMLEPTQFISNSFGKGQLPIVFILLVLCDILSSLFFLVAQTLQNVNRTRRK